MKYLLIGVLSLFIACNNVANQGFTDKAEAKNLVVNGQKEGKWMEYEDSVMHILKDSISPYYALSIYKAGKRYGISRGYRNTGQLLVEMPYVDGKRNGLAKWYYKNGKICKEIPIVDDYIEGIEKWYYRSGKLAEEVPYYNHKKNGIDKCYYPSGKLKSETLFIDGKANGIGKYYYESGKLQAESPLINDKKMVSKNCIMRVDN